MSEHAIHWFDSLDSTMRKAAEFADSDCPSGTVIAAREQTAGYGRHGHAWHSEARVGLYVSEVLRLKICPDSLPVVTLAAGLATGQAITSVTGLPWDLRWPNDILLGQRKCAGILVQLHDKALIVGVGINVNHTLFPPELSQIATSLRIESGGREYPIDSLLSELLRSMDSFLALLMSSGKEPILRLFVEHSTFARGRRVVVDQGDTAIEGVTEGLDSQGFLWVREDTGKRTLIVAGGVRPACS